MAYVDLGKVDLDPMVAKKLATMNDQARLSQEGAVPQLPSPDATYEAARRMVADNLPAIVPAENKKTNKTGLYIAVGVAGAAAIGLAVYFATRNRPAPIVSNRRKSRARRRLPSMRRNFSDRRKSAADALRKAYESGDSRRIREAAERLRAIDLEEFPR